MVAALSSFIERRDIAGCLFISFLWPWKLLYAYSVASYLQFLKLPFEV
jgi:hypothetical protein